MTEAKIGLIIITAIIIAFAFAMRRMGALRTTGAVAAALVSTTIATALFFAQ